MEGECDHRGESVARRVLCFPFGKGSTVGSYAMYQLKLNGVAPAAIVNESAETTVATGAIISDIPMVDRVDISLVLSGDRVWLDADEGKLELPEVEEREVVTCILRRGKTILLLQRSGGVGSYRGQWAGVSGYIEPGESDDDAALREIEEEIGVRQVELVRKIPPLRFRDGDVVWSVHPFLFDLKSRRMRIDWEHEKYEWVLPEDVARYPTVPGLQHVVFRLLEGGKTHSR